MPIANAITQASTSVTQLKACPHIGALNAPGCALRSGTQSALPPPADNHSDQTWQTEGRGALETTRTAATYRNRAMIARAGLLRAHGSGGGAGGRGGRGGGGLGLGLGGWANFTAEFRIASPMTDARMACN
jgi:hypothetical protein